MPRYKMSERLMARESVRMSLIEAAIDYGRSKGARIVEAYPVDREESKNTSLDAFTGFFKTYVQIGFDEVVRRSAKRPIVRYYIES